MLDSNYIPNIIDFGGSMIKGSYDIDGYTAGYKDINLIEWDLGLKEFKNTSKTDVYALGMVFFKIEKPD